MAAPRGGRRTSSDEEVTRMIDVLIAIQEPLVRLGLVAALEGADGVGHVESVAEPGDVLDRLAARPARVAIVDVAWRRADPGLIEGITRRHPETRILVYVAHKAEDCIVRDLLAVGDRSLLSAEAACRLDECCLTSLRERAHGCLPSEATPAQVSRAVRQVAEGEVAAAPWLTALGASTISTPDAPRPLTPRELEVMALLAQGHGNKGIARRLGIKEQTVKNHMARVMSKMGLSNRVQVGVLASRYGLDRLETGQARSPAL
jgi:DNA-binding NarL/FixJ family response regulator